MAGRETFDVSPLEREILEHRQARRQILREQYLEKFYNPYRYAADQGGFVDDIAITRYQAAKATIYEFFKPGVRGGLLFFGIHLIPLLSMIWVTGTLRKQTEDKIRRGELAYRDRDYKIR